MTTTPKTAAARIDLYFRELSHGSSFRAGSAYHYRISLTILSAAVWTAMALLEFGILRASPWLVFIGNCTWPFFRAILALHVWGICAWADSGGARGWRVLTSIRESGFCKDSYELQVRSAETIAGVFTAFEDDRTLSKSLIT